MSYQKSRKKSWIGYLKEKFSRAVLFWPPHAKKKESMSGGAMTLIHFCRLKGSPQRTLQITSESILKALIHKICQKARGSLKLFKQILT